MMDSASLERRLTRMDAELTRLRGQLSEIPVRFPSPGSKGVGSEIQQFRFKSQQANWITCRTWDGMAEGANDVLVVKPWELRPYVFNGRTYSIDSLTRISYAYPASDHRELVLQKLSGGTWTTQSTTAERVYQPWDLQSVGAADKGLIYAFKPVGGTSEEDGDGNAIVWQDANVGARHWRPDAAAGMNVVAGTIVSVGLDTYVMRVGTGPGGVTVAKQHLHRLSVTERNGVTYSNPDANNSSRRAEDAQERWTYQQLIEPFLAEQFAETGDPCVAMDVGEAVTGIAGVRYLDLSSRVWGLLP